MYELDFREKLYFLKEVAFLWFHLPFLFALFSRITSIRWYDDTRSRNAPHDYLRNQSCGFVQETFGQQCLVCHVECLCRVERRFKRQPRKHVNILATRSREITAIKINSTINCADFFYLQELDRRYPLDSLNLRNIFLDNILIIKLIWIIIIIISCSVWKRGKY